MKIYLDDIPEELKARIQWVCWKEVPNPKNPEKPKKVPVDPRTGEEASVCEPSTWSSSEYAAKMLEEFYYDGIGFVFTENDSFVGIDLDNCRNNKTGKIYPWARRIIKNFNSYSEISPSGTGIHIIIKGKLSGKGKNVGDIEIYDMGRYFTMSGNKLPETPETIKKKQNKLDTFYSSLSKPKTEKVLASQESADGSQNDFAVITKVMQLDNSGKFQKLINGDISDYSSASEADLAFCSFLSKVTTSPQVINRIFNGSKLMRPKWDEVHGELTYGKQIISKILQNPNKFGGDAVAKETPQLEVAREVIKVLGRENIFSYAKHVWIWEQDKGLWRMVADDEIKQHIHAVAHLNNINQSHVNSIFGLMKTEVHSVVNPFIKSHNRVINCRNGELHFDGDWQLKPHNRDSFFIHQIPVAYDELAKCERFDIFLRQVFAGDSDCEEKIKLLQEFMGYALTTTCEFERFLILVGSGANGKSVVMAVITALLGAENVSGVQPSQFEDRFMLAHLHGKLANIITEIPEGSVVADAKLKSLTSGERITVQHKFGKPFDITPYATLLFAANHMPHTKDCSQAFFRRPEILTFNVKFEGKQRDETLKEELPKESAGILNFALKGLKRLYKRRNFTQVLSSIAAKKEWERAADQVAAFVHDECELNPAAKIPISLLYKSYENWVQLNGVKTQVSQPVLTKRLERFDCQRRPGGKGVWTMYGIKLKSI